MLLSGVKGNYSEKCIRPSSIITSWPETVLLAAFHEDKACAASPAAADSHLAPEAYLLLWPSLENKAVELEIVLRDLLPVKNGDVRGQTWSRTMLDSSCC
ncbi:unnamed protein product [Pleuronectes platessa]|uniref:Uncharacterized protein n=1 Tax=Pleuronectes platessa TaxID=8262 RepID=A0A9N7UBJ1_PLEPL|nr:unnamed protein product [Pleuronectes platessa]